MLLCWGKKQLKANRHILSLRSVLNSHLKRWEMDSNLMNRIQEAGSVSLCRGGAYFSDGLRKFIILGVKVLLFLCLRQMIRILPGQEGLTALQGPVILMTHWFGMDSLQSFKTVLKPLFIYVVNVCSKQRHASHFSKRQKNKVSLKILGGKYDRWHIYGMCLPGREEGEWMGLNLFCLCLLSDLSAGTNSWKRADGVALKKDAEFSLHMLRQSVRYPLRFLLIVN